MYNISRSYILYEVYSACFLNLKAPFVTVVFCNQPHLRVVVNCNDVKIPKRQMTYIQILSKERSIPARTFLIVSGECSFRLYYHKFVSIVRKGLCCTQEYKYIIHINYISNATRVVFIMAGGITQASQAMT